MKKMLVLFLLSAILVSNAAQSYVQKIDPLGGASVTETRDLSVFLQLFPGGSVDKIAGACATDPSLSCSVSGTIMTTTIELPAGNNYYTIGTDYGIPFITTALTVNRLPTDVFDSSVNNVLNAAGLTSGKGHAEPIELADKGANANLSAAWKEAGLTMNYTIIMPNGYTQTYDLVQLLADSHPIVVTTQEPDYGLMALIAGIIVLAAFTLSFFRKKKGKGKR